MWDWRLLLVFVGGMALAGQGFPMRYRPDLHDQGEVVRLSGKGWRFTMGAVTGAGWTTVYSADFDRNGMGDYLIASHAPLNRETEIVILLMDRKGRPTAWPFTTVLPQSEAFPNPQFPFHPVWVIRKGEHAMFLATDSYGAASSAYVAENGRLIGRRDIELKDFFRWTGSLQWSQEAAPTNTTQGLDDPAAGPIDGIWLVGLGVPEGQEIAIAGERTAGLPSSFVVESAAERVIRIGEDWDELLPILRHRWPVKRLPEGSWIRIDRGSMDAAAQVRAVWETVDRRVGISRKDGACIVGAAGDETFRVCGANWRRWRDGTTEELLADGVTFRTSHTAMNHTVTGECKVQKPAGFARAMGAVWMGDEVLAQWGPRHFTLHGSDGRIILPRVEGIGDGRLISAAGGLMLLQDNGSTVQLHGRIHISRK